MPEGVRRLLELGSDLAEQAGARQLPERFGRVSRTEDLEILLEQPRRGAPGDFMFVVLDRVERRIVNDELETSREDDGAEHADRILEETDFRLADAPDQPGIEVAQAPGVIDDGEGPDVVEEGVYREVASERVFFGGAVAVVTLNQVIFGAPA